MMPMKSLLLADLTRLTLGAAGLRAGPQRLPILIFHRVRATPDPLAPGEIDAAGFEALLRLLARGFKVLTLGEAAQRLQQGELPRRALCITFDDGYADNAEIALPLLQKHGLRASFFVSSGFLDGGRMWNDSIIESVRLSPCQSVDLELLGEPFSAREDLASLPARRALLGKLLGKIKYLTPEQRQPLIEQLQQRLSVRELPRDLMMRSEQVRQLRDAGMEIGAHTVEHPILRTLSADQARGEIQRGREALAQLLDQPIEVFAYPNGKPAQDYEAAHVEMVRELGFKAAVSTSPGIATQGDDLFQLPRFSPWRAPASLGWTLQLLAQYRQPYASA